METTTKATHTPTPWKMLKDPYEIVGKDETHVADLERAAEHLQTEQLIGNAELIVRAVNSHEALLEAAKMARGYMDTLKNRTKTPEVSLFLGACIYSLDQAIAQAEGKL